MRAHLGTDAKVTVTASPALPKAPFYPDATENISASADAATGSSVAGTALITDIPTGDYTFTISHPELKCGLPFPLPIPGGWIVSGLGALCGPGTH